MSLSAPQKSRPSWVDEIIPPVGNQPVRTAKRSNARKSNKSGTVNRVDVAMPQTRSPHPPRFAALQIPIGRARSHAKSVAVADNSNVFLARTPSNGATGPFDASENPSSPRDTDRSQSP